MADRAVPPDHPRFTPPRAALAVALLAVALAAWVATIAICWHTFHQMPPAAGAVAALADAILRGQAPGAEDGRTFLGTYYLPPVPAAVAALRRTGLAWKDAQRLVSIASGVLLLLVVARLAARLGAPRGAIPLALALAIVAFPFKIASVSGRADLLAVACAIAALAAWVRDPGLRGWSVAAFGAAAMLIKAISITTPVAVAVWLLLHRDARGLARFGARFAACLAAGILLALPVHGPTWYAQVTRDLMAAPPGTWSPVRGPLELLRYGGVCAELTVAWAIGFTALAGTELRRSPAAVFGATSLVLAALVLNDFGAGENHLVEMTMVACTVAGAWCARAAGAAALPALAALALAVPAAAVRDMHPLVRHVTKPEYRRAQIIAAIRDEPGPVLTEDALLALSAGRRPEIVDPGALRAFSLRNDPRALRLIEAVRQRRYGLVVLIDDLTAAGSWYRRMHFGDAMVDALLASYEPVARVDGLVLYRRKGDPRNAVGIPGRGE